MVGPGGFTCPDAVVDLRPGGTYRLVMKPPGDGPMMSVTGTYREVDHLSCSCTRGAGTVDRQLRITSLW